MFVACMQYEMICSEVSEQIILQKFHAASNKCVKAWERGWQKLRVVTPVTGFIELVSIYIYIYYEDNFKYYDHHPSSSSQFHQAH